MLAARTKTYCVFGRPGAARAARIAEVLDSLDAATRVALIVEGHDAAELAALPPPAAVIAPGCPCCLGELTMRVTMARVLREQRPDALVLALIDQGHAARVAAWLQAPPWDGLLEF